MWFYLNGSSSGLTSGDQTSLEQNEYAQAVAANEAALYVMPNHDKAVTPAIKFVGYSLNPDNLNARGKAEAYQRGLGYNKSNAEGLIRQISDAVTSGNVKPYDISTSPYGIKYKYRIPVTGPNGKTKNVIAVYQLDNGSEVPRMVTNYLEGR